MSTILEFGCTSKEAKDKIVAEMKAYLEKYSASPQTGMLVFAGFDVPEGLLEYSRKGRTVRLTKDEALSTAHDNGVEIILGGNGIIGALSAFAWFGRPIDSVHPAFGCDS